MRKPHRAGVADVASKICSGLTGEPTNSLLDTLKKDSLLNEISSDQFNHQIHNYEILSFYETRKTDVKIKQRKIFPQITGTVRSSTDLVVKPPLSSISISLIAMQRSSEPIHSLSIATIRRSANSLAAKIVSGKGSDLT